jgi:hypothetical protein
MFMEMKRYLRELSEATEGWRPAALSSGHVGMGPPECCAGDTIAWVVDAYHILVLRTHGDDYRLIGVVDLGGGTDDDWVLLTHYPGVQVSNLV